MSHIPFAADSPPPFPLDGAGSLQRGMLSGFSDSRTHGYQGPLRTVTIQGVSSAGTSAISASADGERCIVAGRDSLRILRISSPGSQPLSEHKFAVGLGGHRLDASKNLFSTKVDGSLTDVVWCRKNFDNKILTCARNGDLVLWDLQKSGTTKLERRVRGHTRAINKLCYLQDSPHYFTTASSDGYLRLWDIRDLHRNMMYNHHSAAIRSAVPGGNLLLPVIGLDNGNICNWDLRMGAKGLLDWIPLAHMGPILSLDWMSPPGKKSWLASGGFDRIVKVWDYVSSDGKAQAAPGHASRVPIYTLHASFPIRSVIWRPGFETELAISSNNEVGAAIFSSGSSTGSSHSGEGASLSSTSPARSIPLNSASPSISSAVDSDSTPTTDAAYLARLGDMLEIWDVRRPWIAKWTLSDSNREGGVADMLFADSHAIWAQHPSGAFSQLDLRACDKPLDRTPNNALTWSATGSLTFVANSESKWEIPYDDIDYGAHEEHRQKWIGDDSYVPSSQILGTMSGLSETENLVSFAQLALSYRLEGASKVDVCAANAEVAFNAYEDESARMWLLLRTLLIDMPARKQAFPHKQSSAPALPHSASAPAGVPSVKKSPPHKVLARSSSSEPQTTTVDAQGAVICGPSSLRASPSSPPPKWDSRPGLQTYQLSVGPTGTRNQGLPPVHPQRPRRNSLRRVSLSSIGAVEDRNGKSNLALSKPRRSFPIGEGALDDSSSSDGEVEQPSRTPSRTLMHSESKRSMSLASSHCPKEFISSPLTKKDDWAEDDQGESASPQSSDTDSDVSKASTRPVRGASAHRPATVHISTLKARNRRSLGSKEIRVTMANGNGQLEEIHNDNARNGLRLTTPEPELVERNNISRNSYASKRHFHTKKQSQTFSVASSALEGDIKLHNADPGIGPRDGYFLYLRSQDILECEDTYREAAWRGLRHGYSNLLESGNVQMCAMLALVASEELGISRFDAVRVIEAYIDILAKLSLHGAAAFIRKHVGFSEVRQTSQIQTTINASCPNCGKVTAPSIYRSCSITSKGIQRVGYSFCQHCKRQAIKCAICRLPIKNAFFICSTCLHGGHEECYRKYYMKRPLVGVPSRSSNKRVFGASDKKGDALAVQQLGQQLGEGDIAATVVGHSCVTGCGHFCVLQNLQ